MNLLGAVAENGDRFFTLVKGRLTGETTTLFLRSLQEEFGEKLVIVLDNAGYFTAKDVKKQAAKDGLLLDYLPPYAPEINPVEQCWRQLNQARGNRLFRDLSELKSFLTTTLPTISSPSIYNYLC